MTSATAQMPDPARGIFETLLVRRGAAVEVERHLERLAASAAALYGAELPAGRAERAIADAAAELDVGRLRLDVRAAGGDVVLEVATAEVAPGAVLPGWAGAIVLAPATVDGGLGDHKWADRDLLGELEPDPARSVALLVDAAGGVLESSRGNVFAVVGGRIVTPPLDGRILPGIARAVALEELRAAGAEVVEAPLALSDLVASEEVLTTGSVRGVEPVRAVARLCEWRGPARWSDRLAERLAARWGLP